MTALRLWTDQAWRCWSARAVYQGTAVDVARYEAATRALSRAWGWQVPTFHGVRR